MRPLVSLFALFLAVGAALAGDPVTVQGTKNSASGGGTVNITAKAMPTPGEWGLAVAANITGSTGSVDTYSKGLTRTTSSVGVANGVTLTILGADATGSRRRVDVQNPDTAATFIRVGGTGTGPGVGTQVYPTGVWTDESSASAAVVVRNDTGGAVTVILTVYQ